MHGNTKIKFVNAKQAKTYYNYKNNKRTICIRLVLINPYIMMHGKTKIKFEQHC